MANIKSSIKRIAVIKKKTLENKMVKTALKTTIKKFDKAVSAGEENSKELMNNAVISLDKAASRGIIHKNAAARKKSRLAKKLNALSAQN